MGAILGRPEAHVLRLSVLYAILDQSPVITVRSLRAPLAVWDYAERSAADFWYPPHRPAPADAILEPLRQLQFDDEDRNLRAIQSKRPCGRHRCAALAVLEDKRLAKRSQQTPEGGKGRPVEIWQATA